MFSWSYNWGIPGGFISVSLSIGFRIGWRYEEFEATQDIWKIVVA